MLPSFHEFVKKNEVISFPFRIHIHSPGSDGDEGLGPALIILPEPVA